MAWAPELAVTRMYRDRREMFEGLLKNIHGLHYSALRLVGFLTGLVGLFLLPLGSTPPGARHWESLADRSRRPPLRRPFREACRVRPHVRARPGVWAPLSRGGRILRRSGRDLARPGIATAPRRLEREGLCDPGIARSPIAKWAPRAGRPHHGDLARIRLPADRRGPRTARDGRRTADPARPGDEPAVRAGRGRVARRRARGARGRGPGVPRVQLGVGRRGSAREGPPAPRRIARSQLETFARLETLNMGKPLRESRGDIGYARSHARYFAGLADKIQGETIPVPGPRFDYTLREPLGVTVHIAPWNYPLLLSVRSVAPALAAGNSVVLKPASLTPLTAVSFARLAKEAGVPDGILNVVLGSGSEVGEALVDDDRCRSVTFTGSGEVGTRIAELATRRRVPLTLELGGKGRRRLPGRGPRTRQQGDRVRDLPERRPDVLGRLPADRSRDDPGRPPRAGADDRRRAEARAGDGRGRRDGPARLPRPGRPRARLHLGSPGERGPGPDRRRESDRSGARGGELRAADRPRGPSVLRAGVARGDLHPVLTVASFSEPEEALRLANDTTYGLLGTVWTRDLATAHAFARRLECGMVVVNEAPITYPQAPFAGTKGSGIGFEQGLRAVEGYTQRTTSSSTSARERSARRGRTGRPRKAAVGRPDSYVRKQKRR